MATTLIAGQRRILICSHRSWPTVRSWPCMMFCTNTAARLACWPCGERPVNDAPTPLRLLQLNSLLTGGGTDDQCAKLALGLHRLGHRVTVAGPAGREFSIIIRGLGVPFHATPPEGPLK